MKKWITTDIKWAENSDLKLPFWKNFEKTGDNFEKWAIPYLFSKLPLSEKLTTFVSSKSEKSLVKYSRLFSDQSNTNENNYGFAIFRAETPDEISGICANIISRSKYRSIFVFELSDTNGIPANFLRQIEETFKIKVPPIPQSSSAFPRKDTRILTLTVDSRDEKPSVAIMIPHWNSWVFLRPCLEYIKKYRNPDITEKVYVLDDTSTDGSFEKAKEYFKNDKEIEFIQISRINKNYSADIGLLLDEGLKHVQEEYVAMIDADLFPINIDWLLFPIKILNDYNCCSVGMDSGLSNSYKNLANFSFWETHDEWLPSAGLKDNQQYTHTNNLYRLMRTSTAKVVSENIGFTRCDFRSSLIEKIIFHVRRRFLFWFPYRKRWPYFPGGEDNGVAANHFMDINRMGPKFNIPITGYLGHTPKDGVFGQNIAGLVFHFALSTRALSSERREISDAGEAFNFWVNKLTSEGISDENIGEMIEESSKIENIRSSLDFFLTERKFMENLIRKYS